jgi:hypothetical protein
MTVIASRPTGARASQAATVEQNALTHGVWFVGVAVLAFLVPYLLTSVARINTDVYYLCYFAVALSVLALYVVANRVDVPRLFTQSWRLSLALGVITTAFVIWNVLVREDSTARPDGAYFVFQLGWRGLAYGVVDALLLTAFPAAVAFALMGHNISGLGRHLKFAALMLPLTVIITATYHLGYEQYREDGLSGPETGNVIMSVPAIASGNPLGSVIAHAAMHETAVVHAYETDVFLPPQKSAD